MPERAESDAPATPRNSSEPLDSGVSSASPAAVRDTEPTQSSRDTELDGAFPAEPERTPVAGSVISADGKRPDEDTLLSAPRPADRLELVVEDRLAAFDMRLDALEARIETVERAKLPQPSDGTGRWWVWIFFLLALAVAWKALEALK